MRIKNILHLFSIPRAFSVHSVLFHFIASKFCEQVQGKRDQWAKETLSSELDMGVYHGIALEPGGLKETVLLLKKNQFFRLTYKVNVRKLIFLFM